MEIEKKGQKKLKLNGKIILTIVAIFIVAIIVIPKMGEKDGYVKFAKSRYKTKEYAYSLKHSLYINNEKKREKWYGKSKDAILQISSDSDELDTMINDLLILSRDAQKSKVNGLITIPEDYYNFIVLTFVRRINAIMPGFDFQPIGYSIVESDRLMNSNIKIKCDKEEITEEEIIKFYENIRKIIIKDVFYYEIYLNSNSDKYRIDFSNIRKNGEIIYGPNASNDSSSNSNNTSNTTKIKCTVCNGTGSVKYYYGSSSLEAALNGHDDYEFGPCSSCNGTGYKSGTVKGGSGSKICGSCNRRVDSLQTKKDASGVSRTWCSKCWSDYNKIMG